jgi:hypothetical protein
LFRFNDQAVIGDGSKNRSVKEKMMFRYAAPKLSAAHVQASFELYKHRRGSRERFNDGGYAAVRRDAGDIHCWECQERKAAENTACRAAKDRAGT